MNQNNKTENCMNNNNKNMEQIDCKNETVSGRIWDQIQNNASSSQIDARNLMLSGQLYNYADQDLMTLQDACTQAFLPFNHDPHMSGQKRRELLQSLCESFGQSWIEPPLYSNWGLHQLICGDHVYINFNCMFVDDGTIQIDDFVMIGPGVTLVSGSHPADPQIRSEGLQFTDPIHICENAWIGAGAIIMPGVTIGRNSIVGAGSVVTRDIPDNVIAVGNPCRVMRAFEEKDALYYHKDWKIHS